MIKELWALWIDFTEFRAIRKCYRDEMIYGNSYKIKKWWGWKSIRPICVHKTEDLAELADRK